MRALAILGMMALYVAGYAWSAPHTDSADELMRGYEIARGLAFPLQGPPLGQVLHLGPAWFYLMAPPLLAWKSWLAGALFVGLVASLKFPLAYACGRRLLDARFGLLWAAALLLPGWPTLEQLVFLNPNGVAAAILAVLALSLRAYDGPRLHHFAGLGLLLAIAAHVHPNAAPAALCVLPVAARFRREGGSLVRAGAAFLATFVLPFLPYAYRQVAHGYPDFQAASRYVQGEITAAGLLNAPSIAWHYVATGPQLVAEYLGRWPHAAAVALGLGLAGIHVAAAALALFAGDGRTRRVAWGALAAVAVFSLWIGAMRVTTPMQFAWALAPATTAVLALGLHAVTGGRHGRSLVIALVAALALGDAAAWRAMALRVEDGEGRLPSLVLDIKGRLPAAEYVGGWFPAYAHDRLGTLLCVAPKPLSLHGHLGYLVDQDIGLDTLFACGRRDGIVLRESAVAPGRNLLGMSRGFWRALGRDPGCTIGSLGITSRMAVPRPQEALAVAPGDAYLPRTPSGQAPRDEAIAFEGAPDAALLVTNLLGNYEPFALESVQADGTLLAPAARNTFAALYVPPAGSAPIAWAVRWRAAQPAGIDVVLVPREGSPEGCAALAAAR